MSDASADTPLAVIQNTLRIVACGYYFWFILYVILGIASVALPSAIAADIWPGSARIIAGCGALCGAVLAFLKPHEYATAYDAALTELWKLEVKARLGNLTDAEAADGVERAIAKTAFKYGNLALPKGERG